MSVAAKVRLTEIFVGDKRQKHFQVPADKARAFLVLLKDYEVEEDEDSVSSDEALEPVYRSSSKAATRLRGFRQRDEWTQSKLAKELKTSQSVIAAMENGSRVISEKMARKLAALFDTDFRAFL